MPHALPTRRAALAAAVLTTTSACGLRLEKDAPLPGPTAEAAPDSTPLEAVRAHLVAAMEAASHETRYAREAAAIQTVHVAQLKRIDATLTGIGASSLPTVTATSAPTPSSSASSSTSATSKAASPAASTSPSTSPAPTSWTRAEREWASPTMCANAQKVSSKSRPLALAVAARGIAALPAGIDVSWSSTAALRGSSALADATRMTIHALEWWAAHTPLEQRDAITATLADLYAVRSLLDADSSPSTPAPARRYDSSDAARADVREAAPAMLSACAGAASSTRDADDVNGLLLAWTSAIRALTFAGGKPTAFPGLAEH